MNSNDTLIGAIILSVVFLILYISGIVHASIRLNSDKLAKNHMIRIIMLLVAIFFIPFYWFIYPIVYLSGGFA